MPATASPGETSFTLQHPPYTYLHVIVTRLKSDASITTGSDVTEDEVTVRSFIATAMQQYLGLTGAAIRIDVLKVAGSDLFIRVPNEDESAVVAALSQWTSGNNKVILRVAARGTWLGGLVSHPRKNEKLWTMET